MAVFPGTPGDDIYSGGGEDDSIFGRTGADELTGGEGADVLRGGGGDDILRASDASNHDDGAQDILIGGPGSDTMFGGRGDIFDGGRHDDPAAVDAVVLDLSDTTLGLSIDMRKSVDGKKVALGDGGYLVNVEQITLKAGSGDDHFSGVQPGWDDQPGNSVEGGAGDDSLFGGRGADVLHGDDGADKIVGGGGFDTVQGGRGNDTIDGAAVVDYSTDPSVTRGLHIHLDQHSYVTIVTGDGTDLVRHVSRIVGGGFDDLIEDGGLWVTHRPNRFDGFEGDDTLKGIEDDDTLIGGEGADLIVGGRGVDRLIGGASGEDGEVDTFLIDGKKDSPNRAADTIAWLESIDVIDLEAFDADRTQGGNQAFVLVAEFTGEAGELRLVYRASDDLTLVQGDNSGDGLADFTIKVEGEHTGFDNFVL